MKWKVNMKNVITFVLCAALSLGVAVRAGLAATETAQAVAAPVTIQKVQMRGDGAAPELIVSVSAPATYTSYKTSAPHRLVLDFSQAIPAESLTDLNINQGPVKGVTLKRFDTDAGTLTRMEIFLAQDVEPVITPSTEKLGELRISFPGYKPEPVQQAALPESKPATITQNQAATEAQAVPATVEQPKSDVAKNVSIPVSQDIGSLLITDVVASDNGVRIATNGPVKDFKTFRLNKPERIVVDIPNAKAGMTNKLVQLNVAGVSTARIGSYSDKVRIVFDAISNSLPDATFEKSATGLKVQFVATGADKQSVAALPAPPEKNSQPLSVPKAVASTTKEAALPPANQVSAIDFQVIKDISRVTIKVNGAPVSDSPIKSAGFVSFRIKNVQVPRNLQRSLETREFNSPVLRITPVQIKTKTGHDVMIRVALKNDAPFELRREADVIYLDFKNPAYQAIAVAQKRSATAITAVAAASDEQQIAKVADQPANIGKHLYSGRKVSLEFADAEVRKIFQLLSEVSNKNFVLGDEVTGTISLKLINVPWDQALDIILDTKGLDKREEGNIILIRGKGKFKSLLDEEAEIRKATLKGEALQTTMFDVNYADLASIATQFTALKTDRGMITTDQRTNKIIVKDVKSAIDDMRNILKNLDIPEKQVMIEARIVEASTTFTQSLGVNWGIHYRDGSAAIAGINSMDTSFGGLASNVAPSTGVSGQPGAAAGISFGTLSSNIKLDMRLNAAVSAGLIRIVSTPKVATLNHKSAKITQGQQIPYTAATSDKIETKFVEAALALEVTPHINPNGTIIMKIDAKNDAPGASGNPPPINKKQATTEMMLRDGETTVIGGIYVESESNSDDGVPYLKDVPWLGGLFKSNESKRNRSELLIFITPRIISDNS